MLTVYMDEPIQELKISGLGCHIGHEYYGSPNYTVDLQLLCPSITSLQEIMNRMLSKLNKWSV